MDCSRRWIAGVAAGLMLAVLRPETVSLAQEPAGCPTPAAEVAVQADAPPGAGCPTTTTATQPPADPVPPAPEPPADVPAAPDPAPVQPVAPAEPVAPAPDPPAAAPEISVTAQPAAEPARPATAPAATPRSVTPRIGVSEPRKLRVSRRPVRVRNVGERSVPARDVVAAPSPRTVSIDWTRLDPLALPPFPADVASTFPGPAFLLPIFHAAAAQFGVPWHVLAAINEIETNFGKNTSVSSAGAIGWMQFMPATWKRWGMDANGDGERDPHDPVDAIFSAARYLQAAGAEEDLARAIFAYNHAGWYVEDVTERARRIGSIPADVLAALTARGRRDAHAIKRATGSRGLLDPHAEVDGVGRVILMGERRLRRHVLRSGRVHIYGCGRQDIRRGIVDRRVLETLIYLAYADLEPTVSSLRCGHGYFTKAGSVSHHSSGDAVDIAAINGTPILGHQGRGSMTDDTVRELLKLTGALRPDQIITLMAYEGAPNTLAMGDHHDHIHVGFEPARRIHDSGPDAPNGQARKGRK